uniref:RING-type domain-containing protein n=1 Tax=Percolomonas cosmopolitus TaxID=63605 RepID=A0A7S1PEW1_9EUKA
MSHYSSRPPLQLSSPPNYSPPPQHHQQHFQPHTPQYYSQQQPHLATTSSSSSYGNYENASGALAYQQQQQQQQSHHFHQMVPHHYSGSGITTTQTMAPVAFPPPPPPPTGFQQYQQNTPRDNPSSSRKRKFFEVSQHFANSPSQMHSEIREPSTWLMMPWKRQRVETEPGNHAQIIQQEQHQFQSSHAYNQQHQHRANASLRPPLTVHSLDSQLKKYNESVKGYYDSMCVSGFNNCMHDDMVVTTNGPTTSNQTMQQQQIVVPEQQVPLNAPRQVYDMLGYLSTSSLSGCNKQNLLLLLNRLKSSVSLIENQLEEHVFCVVCMEKERKVICVPCGHLVCCGSCLEGQSECPVCRSAIEKKMLVYDG